jgi:hypothetical protein
MSYIFPRRLLRAQDVLDPIELTLDLSPAAERISGHLNAHNFNMDIASTVSVDKAAYHALQYYQKDVGFDTGPLYPPDGWGWPDHLIPADAYSVQNNFEWQSILDSGAVAAQVALTTGGSVLWVNAYAQYLWQGFDWTKRTGVISDMAYKQHAYGSQTSPANIQFAIRLDGSIVSETVTGMDEVIYRSSIPIRQTKQRSGTTPLPGPHDLKGEQIVALGPPCLPIRITACLPVQAGDHTVEIVVRRVPLVGATSSTSYLKGDRVFVYSRQVFVADLKSFPVDSVASTDVSVPSFEEEDDLTNATMYTQRVQPLIAAYNDVAEGNLQRGALMHYHLPNVLLQKRTAEVTYAAPVAFNSYFNGTSTVTLSSYTGAAGWTPITDGVAPLRVTNVATTAGRQILVLANAQVRNIEGGSDTDVISLVTAARIDAFAFFQIMSQKTTDPATTWNSLGESRALINNFVWWPKKSWTGSDPLNLPTLASADPRYGLEQVEIQLMVLLDYSAIGGVSPINIGVFGACLRTQSGQNTEYQIRYGSIQVLSFRA